MLDWISLDDVLYRWDGQDIVCETGVGYSAKMEGNHLDGLDIIDNATDAVVGQLFVDFVSETLKYAPVEGEATAGVLHYSVDGHEAEISLSQLPSISALDDIVADDSDSDLWSSIAAVSQTHAVDIFSEQSVDHLDVLHYSDDSLDLVLQTMGDPSPLPAPPDVAGISSGELESLYMNTAIPDPFDILKNI